ncbi:lytic transglycosylase [Escherichia coli O45:H12]|nr:lytic transglycosylase [Escherichia coli]OTC28892.1 lytic transglycosylase [Escherichia coli]
MPGGEDFILRPALAFHIDQKDLNSGAVDLCRIALLNDYLDMCEDNDVRVEKWREDNERRDY